MNVVEYHGHPVAWSFGETNISRYHRLEYLAAEEASQVGRDLLRESRAIIVHCQQDSLYSERRIDRAAQTHERIEQL
jgi:hypothetical protein